MNTKNPINLRCLSQCSSTLQTRVSPRFEWDEFRSENAVARILSDLARHGPAGDAHDGKEVPRTVAAVFAVVECWLRLPSFAVSDGMDPMGRYWKPKLVVE
jgi:hypothetical protein